MLAVEVIAPVGREVSTGSHSAEFQDGFGSGQAPPGAGDVQPVADQVAAGALDDAGGDRPAILQRLVVAQVFDMAGQVTDAGIDPAALLLGESGRGGLSVDGGGDLLGVAGQQGQGAGGDPVFGAAASLILGSWPLLAGQSEMIFSGT